MLEIDAGGGMEFGELNEAVRSAVDGEVFIRGCSGQRYIASGLSGKRIEISGVPGNALGSYLDGCSIDVRGNVQDATGDTMNGGEIVVHGNAGDATGYAMRGGAIFIRGNTGYRAGIHMKAYKEQKPALVVGGKAGAFLGEYQAGGTIVVLGLPPADGNDDGRADTGEFLATGMHGGKIFLRLHDGGSEPAVPDYVEKERGLGGDLPELADLLRRFCAHFGDADERTLLASEYLVLEPNKDKPYKQTYCTN